MLKKSLLLLSLSILFQSCYSYKSVNRDHFSQHTDKNIKIITKQNKKVKGLLSTNTVGEIIVSSGAKKATITIPKESIRSIEIREFSYLKTIGTALSTILTVVLLGAVKAFHSN